VRGQNLDVPVGAHADHFSLERFPEHCSAVPRDCAEGHEPLGKLLHGSGTRIDERRLYVGSGIEKPNKKIACPDSPLHNIV